MSLKEIFKLVLGWRLILILIAIPAMFLLAPRPRFTTVTALPSALNLSTMWSNFDGAHYLKIAELGYGFERRTDMDYAFFPVYPWAVRTFNIFGNYLASGLFLSHLFFILALFYLYKLIILDYKPKIAKSTIYLLLFFPTAFFFGSVYSESLFLLLAVLSFYFSRKNNFFLACLFAGIASATRVTGIFLWPALIYEFWQVYGKEVKVWLTPSIVWLLVPPIGLISFLRFQFLQTGDPFFFVNYQTDLAGMAGNKLILLHQVFFRYFKMIIFMDHMDPLFFTVLLELACSTLIVLVLIFSIKKMRPSYWIFTFLSFLLPTFVGSFSSMPRFTLVLFPIFISLALWLERNHPYFKYAYYLFCIIFTAFAVIFFTRGYFVA